MSNSNKPRPIIIAGPTCSGKSERALSIARNFSHAWIINADSLQIYQDVPVLTAQPSKAEQQTCQHFLYGFHPVLEPYSVSIWLSRAQELIHKAINSGTTPIIVGGTGMYLQKLLFGISTLPSIAPQHRCETENLLKQLGNAEFFKLLQILDPVSAAKLHQNDSYRILRAYEIAKYTGKTIGEWHGAQKKEGEYNFELIKIELPRDELYQRCESRFDAMLQCGALEEVVKLREKYGKNHHIGAFKAIGITELSSYLDGEISIERAVELAKTATRQYAKRQCTWFRNQFAQ